MIANRASQLGNNGRFRNELRSPVRALVFDQGGDVKRVAFGHLFDYMGLILTSKSDRQHILMRSLCNRARRRVVMND